MTPKCSCGRKAMWVLKKRSGDWRKLCASCAWTHAATAVLVPIEAVHVD